MRKKYITTAAAAKLIGITAARVRQLVDVGLLESKKFGHVWRIGLMSARKVARNPPGGGRPRGAKNKIVA